MNKTESPIIGMPGELNVATVPAYALVIKVLSHPIMVWHHRKKLWLYVSDGAIDYVPDLPKEILDKYLSDGHSISDEKREHQIVEFSYEYTDQKGLEIGVYQVRADSTVTFFAFEPAKSSLALIDKKDRG